jgi:hypothetical protein
MYGARSLAASLSLAIGVLLSSSAAKAGVVLITAEEAQLAPPQLVASSRGITRAPRIELSAEDEAPLHSPFHLRLQFHAFGGSSIDPNSVTITYLRRSNVDLTPRVRPFIRQTGIDIPDAEAPPGAHMIRVYVTDSDGRQATANFTLNVAPD